MAKSQSKSTGIGDKFPLKASPEDLSSEEAESDESMPRDKTQTMRELSQIVLKESTAVPAHLIIEHVEIPMSDGRKLAARVWLPVEEKPAPAVMEYVPYRKRDGTTLRDDKTFPEFAGEGIAGVRVDVSGNGDSEGLFDDEYSEQELSDGEEVIAWIAAQPWCNGKVGVMGISWSGFNALQLAARRPESLGAIISLGSTIDRYNDDIHYKNGCQLSANFSWSSTMLCYAARSPDPLVVGERWKAMWRERLETHPFPLADWLKHQRRDDYWKHGSVGETPDAITCPVLIMSGWMDGYLNAPPAAATKLGTMVKAVNGPWIHKYPDYAWPRPRMDFLGEAVRWWKRWLNDEANEAENLPAYRAYITEGVRPAARREFDAGRWVQEENWPSDNVVNKVLFLGDGVLENTADGEGQRELCSPEDCGSAAGEFFTVVPGPELAGDQRVDDAGSLVFETEGFSEAMDLLGRPKLTLPVSIDRTRGNLIARLVDVHPDGTSYRISWGALNLCHRGGNESPEEVVPGCEEVVSFELNECGYRVLAGHRLRLSISTAYFPMVLPAPEKVRAKIRWGEQARLVLPERVSGEDVEVLDPQTPDGLPPYPEHRPGEGYRKIERDLGKNLTTYHIYDDGGEHEVPGHGMIVGELRDDRYEIDPDDPLSFKLEGRYDHSMRRGDWKLKVETRSRLTADRDHFYLWAEVVAYIGEEEFHRREWRESIARDFM